MSSRAFRRLNRDADVIRISENAEEGKELEEEPEFISVACKKKTPAANPFALLNESDDAEDESEDKEEELNTLPSKVAKKPRKKKKRRKARVAKEEPEPEPRDSDQESGDEVDVAVREVNKLLGEVGKERRGEREEGEGEGEETESSPVPHSLLKVDRRFLNAENEMRRIFGSKVVRGDQVRQKAHRKVHLRPTVLATPKDTWPKIEKLGLTMQQDGVRDWCQYFHFEHSPAYQKIQLRFWEAVDTFDPNSIAAILHAHPYHVDSLLQMSEVSRLGEDIQMASELIERALCSFESSFHTLFNYTQANCRLDYSRAENRSFFLTLFRHLSYISRRGCHRTALEFCKLLLALNPEKDPLCALLIIDYCAVRGGEYRFLIDLFHAWEPHRNLSQLPNFAFSVPLAMFHSQNREEKEGEGGGETEANKRLQDALLMFPCLLPILLDKCGVTLDPAVTSHSLFTQPIEREPNGLKLLMKLYVERSHSLWKEPEVLTWLEANCRVAVARANDKDPLNTDFRAKAVKRYSRVPRNIYRHILISDLDHVVSALPPDMTQTSINSYDPLPPPDSTCGYERPQIQRGPGCC
ncbi:Transcription factor 25 [Geodia barretti]|uniref:Transcription factor 25 n=1 Tax=Geodia barretti TaxID=519541 RepID=A0AA35T5W8_GEOBA|nr:Transcription factor 25 [Geodia barretti]